MSGKSSFLMAVLAILVLYTSFTAWAEEVKISPVEVVLFREGAMVKREAKIRVTPEVREYIIYGLSPYFREDTLQIQLKPREVEVIEAKVFDTFLKEPFEKKRKQLQEELKAIESEIAEKEAKKKAIEASLELVNKKDTCGRPLLQCLKEAGPLLEEYHKNIATLSLDISELKEKKKKIEKELQGLGSPEKTEALRLRIRAPEVVDAILRISYFVDKARWKPYYIFRVDTRGPELDIQYMAELEQMTGQDWQDVRVTLSTERPFLAGQLPKPKPWFVDLYEPTKPERLYKALPLGKEMVSEERKPRIREEILSFKVDLPDRINIPSGVERTKMVLVAQKSTPLNLSYRAFPKATERVFLEGRFKNPFEMPIFYGQGIIFVDGSMSNRISIKRPILPGAEVDLSFGVDPTVTVKKIFKRKYTETKGLFNKEKKVRYEYEIEVQNGKSKEITLTLQDTLPVSSNEKIVIETIIPEPEKAKITKDGIVTWTLILKPHEKKTLPLIFTVRYPEDSKVVGLP